MAGLSKLRVGVLVSGFGSNLQALIDQCAQPDFPAEIVTVISNKPGAGALDRAARAGIASRVIRHQDFPDRASFDQALDAALRADRVELVCLAGFMRVLTAEFVTAWQDRILNIHPSLLPAFRGLDTHRRALEAGVRFHGCTVHIVRPDLDDGPILVQGIVPVRPDDDESTLAARILELEHQAYPQALRLIAEGRVRIEGKRALIVGAVAPAGPSGLNPRLLPSVAG
ncbi:MAG TPA: phosphoribosylglycinamide formyltransferase [Aliidongia sp.]|nr:phosphoribosylglycinamide formyltransferase [Aliidongia sp.]